MKQILLTVAMLAVALTAGAQNKDQLLSSIDKAKAATENEKKAANPTTWIKYGDAFLNAYNALFGDQWIGISKTESMLLGGGKPLSQEQVQLNGAAYSLEHYEFRDLYYNSADVLEMVIITKPIMDEDLLVQARDAYLKAAEVDAKGSKAKVLSEKLIQLRDKFVNDAMSYYTLGNVEKAAYYFEESLPCSENPVVNGIDSMIVYYTGVAYNAIGNTEKAKKYYEECLAIGYDQAGDVAASLAEIAKSEGNTDLAKKYLNEAFAKYPSSQSVLVSLINLYMETNDDPQKILDLIKSAQANEPKNASLVYAEGNVYKGLGDIENAVKCYYRSSEIDPNYVYGVYSVGNTYFDEAIAIQDKMNALDINDVEGYDALQKEFEKYLEMSIEPFEKAFNMTEDKDVKIAVASALKQVYFRFRTRDAKYAEGYEKYNQYLATEGVE
ncbi:MAG TPA: tetratricopeptide repeat protein [Candidatus Coprenecus avistercoris]|uniref:Tetratricopeptide repeat protein n=1 Tax=Candidatus Coprenecus avistercoris TaxID=2840730 RepID=A0A9D1E010_9BACT|nr:tetratricopeptide repeat protein [Candidatus Coprenecus avistercoris]